MIDMDRLVVGVVGTANVGKTTFINDVVTSAENTGRDKDLQWSVFGRDYRAEIERRGLAINRNGNEECQQAIHDVLLQNVRDAVDEPFRRRMLMDRTVLDSFAYTYWHHRYGTAHISEDTLSKMWRQVVAYSKAYSAILYIPLSKCADVGVVDDKFRDTNAEYRSQIDLIFQAEFLALLRGGANMKLMYGDREKRVDWFYAIEDVLVHENLGFGDRNGFEECLDEVMREGGKFL